MDGFEMESIFELLNGMVVGITEIIRLDGFEMESFLELVKSIVVAIIEHIRF